MRRFCLLALLLFACRIPARAQFVSVTATVNDPTGTVYQNCSGNVNFVPSPTATTVPTISGSTFQTTYPIASCDSFGKFSLTLPDNSLISDGHTGGLASQWSFFIRSADVCFAGQKFSFSATLTITGSSQDISSSLQSAAATLPTCSGVGGTISPNQVAFGSSFSKITGSANLLYGSSSLPDGILINAFTPSCSGATHLCAVLGFNATGAATTGYIQKGSDNSLVLTNDDNSIPTHGYLKFDGSTGNGVFSAGSGSGSNIQMFAASGGSFLPLGSILLTAFGSTSVYSFGTPSAITNSFAYQFSNVDGCHRTFPQNSTTASTILCPFSSGQTDVATAVSCGTVAANAACSNSVPTNFHCVSGIATLSGGTSTVTGIAPAFTSSSSWFAVTNDVTTAANVSKGVPASGSTITFTGTGTDNIAFIACGG